MSRKERETEGRAPRRRLRPSAGAEAFAQYAAELQRLSATPPIAAGPTRVDIVVADCRSLSRLSQGWGSRVLLIRAAVGGEDVAASLNRARYASLIVDDTAQHALVASAGWDDWRPVPVEYDMARGPLPADGLAIARGRLSLPLPRGVGVAAFRRRFSSLMSARRHPEALTTGEAVTRRLAAGLRGEARPRFFAPGSGEGVERVDDLYVFDPWRDLGLLATTASAASLPDLGSTDRNQTFSTRGPNH